MAQEGKRDFVNHSFFKVVPEWRRLAAEEGSSPNRDQRGRSKGEFADVVEEFADRMSLVSYSLVDTRGDPDLLLWMVSPTLEGINEQQAMLNRSKLGRYLTLPHSYLAMALPSPYVDQHRHPGQESAGSAMRIVGRKYLFVYPFVKTHDWYQLPQVDRQRMMDQHFVIGHRYPTVKISTAYSFGLDDPEFVLGFETDDPGSIF
jgi:chlorite dismutase